MHAFSFDTLEYVAELEKGGIKREHAETLAKANARAFQSMFESRNPASRDDLKLELARMEKELKLENARLERELKLEIAELRENTRQDMANLEKNLIKWMAGIMLAGLAVGLGGISIFMTIIMSKMSA